MLFRSLDQVAQLSAAELDCRLLAIEVGGAQLRDLVERYACDILIVR